MFETFRKIRYSLVFVAVCCIGLGIALLLAPEQVLTIGCKVIGGVFIFSGIVGILSCIKERAVLVFSLFFSIISISAGVFIFTDPKAISSILPVIVGAILLLDGLFNVRHGIGLRHIGVSSGSVLIMGIITVVLGALVIFNPYTTATLSVRLIGIALIYNGISDLVIVTRVNTEARRWRKKNGIIDVEATPVEDDD